MLILVLFDFKIGIFAHFQIFHLVVANSFTFIQTIF